MTQGASDADQLLNMIHIAEENLDLGALRRLPGVSGGDVRGEVVTLTCADSDAALRALLARYPEARDVEVHGAGLEQAFLQLTDHDDRTDDPEEDR